MNQALKLVIAFAVLVAVVFVFGSNLPADHVATAKVQLNQPPAKVWDALTNYEKMPEWNKDIAKVEKLPKSKSGNAVWRMQCTWGKAMDIEVTKSQRPSMHVSRIANSEELPFGGEWIFVLSNDKGGTTVALTEKGWLKNPFCRAFGYVTGYDRMLKQHLSALAKRFGENAMPETVPQS